MEAENVVMLPTQPNSSQQDQQVDEPGHGGGCGSKVRPAELIYHHSMAISKIGQHFETASIQQLI